MIVWSFRSQDVEEMESIEIFEEEDETQEKGGGDGGADNGETTTKEQVKEVRIPAEKSDDSGPRYAVICSTTSC